MQNPLYCWLKARKFWGSSPDDQRTITHVFMDGGKAHVPDHAVDEFIERYCSALRNGHKQYVVECRTPIFRLFMDIDLQSKSPVDSETVLKVCELIRATSAEFFEPMDSSTIVCTCPERTSGNFHKRGVHMHWTNVYVSSSKALTFRNLVLRRCVDAFGECYAVPWAQILDMTVYTSSGLRLIGSSKKDAPGEYLPWRVFTGDAVHAVQDPRQKMTEWVAATSIRTTMSLKPDPTDEKGEERILKSEYKGDFVHLNLKEHASLVEQVVSLIESKSDGKGNRFYQKFRTTALYKIKNGKTLTYVMGTDCKNCMNKVSGVHRSNHVYFLMNESGLFQKCFCRCEVTAGRNFKMCKEFVFRIASQFPARLHHELFGSLPERGTFVAETEADRLKKQYEKILGRK